MVKDKPLKLLLWPIIFTLGFVLSLAIGGALPSVNAATDTDPTNANAYDISEYQGYVNDNQASQLKNEVNFMILKAENGGLYTDPQFNHNAEEMSSHNIPYGVYDYSLYANPAQAQDEAQALYQRAPQAKFYVNDSEENNAGSQFNAATQAWANEIHQLTKKPAVLYSGLYFMNNHFTPQTRNAYDALWVADYGVEPSPAYHYDLWQAADNHYSPALGQRVDASVFPDGNDKPLSFWTGKDVNRVARHHKNRSTKVRKSKPVVRPRRHHHRKDAKVNNIRKPKVKVNKKRRRARKSHRNNKTVTSVTRKGRKKKHQRSKASKRIRKFRRNRRDHNERVKVVYNPKYYRSKRIHYLKVIGQNGIGLYNMQGHHLDDVAPGTILNVYGFKPVYHRQTGYMTKAIGMHFGQYDLFTSRKDLVQWYK